jgi:hypothetical protein
MRMTMNNYVARMKTTVERVVPAVAVDRIGGGKWTATAMGPDGPLTAIGGSVLEAKGALDQLLVIARALKFTRSKSDG